MVSHPVVCWTGLVRSRCRGDFFWHCGDSRGRLVDRRRKLDTALLCHFLGHVRDGGRHRGPWLGFGGPQRTRRRCQGDYLVADTFNHRIQLCPGATPGSACETVAGDMDGRIGGSPYLLNNPSDVDVIPDTSNNRVQRCPAASPGAACETILGTGEAGDDDD